MNRYFKHSNTLLDLQKIMCKNYYTKDSLGFDRSFLMAVAWLTSEFNQLSSLVVDNHTVINKLFKARSHLCRLLQTTNKYE